MKFSYYYVFRNVIKGMNNKKDITNFYDKFIKDVTDPVEKDLINSLLSGIGSVTCSYDYQSFIAIINKLLKISYKVEAGKFVENVVKNTDDPAQVNTMYRILKMKEMQPHIVSLKEIRDELESSDDIPIYDKCCPHCGMHYFLEDETGTSGYRICGYTDEGFDWNGCGKDWCVKCEKKLCKSWQTDQLHDKNNRVHNKKCCKKHALDVCDVYPDEYCMCTESYVDRRTA